jgi:hypothetical protein
MDYNAKIAQTDSIVQSVVDELLDRSTLGKEKYGTTMDREDLTFLQWTQHLKEELLDATLYLTKLQTEAKNLQK